MDALNTEAIAALRSIVAGLLPAAGDPADAPVLHIESASIRPTGIGGYVGPHPDPIGDLEGRTVEARLRIDLAGDVNTLATRYASLVDALLAQGAGELRAAGLLQFEMDPPVGDVDTATARALSLDVLFDFIKVPETAGDVIESTPLQITVQ